MSIIESIIFTTHK